MVKTFTIRSESLTNTVFEMGEVIVLGKLLLYTLECMCPDQIHCTDKWVKTLRKPADTLFFVVGFSLSGRCTPSLSQIVSMWRLCGCELHQSGTIASHSLVLTQFIELHRFSMRYRTPKQLLVSITRTLDFLAAC